MRIVRLESQNVKRLKAVSIVPEGNAVVIGGNNAQGKSSVLDSIFMALGGKVAQGQNPVREGEERAVIKCDLGELLVTRTITAEGKTTVKVQNAEGAAFSSPQAMLDALSSKLTFDPLVFANEKPLAQLSTLKELVGLDFSELDSRRAEVFSKRTEVNRKGKEEAARFNSLDFHADAPSEPVSVAVLMDQLREAEAFNSEVAEYEAAINSRQERIKEVQEEIAALQLELAHLEESETNAPEPKPYVDVEKIRTEISQADAINMQVRENLEYRDTEAGVEALRAESLRLTEALKEIDNKKSDLMASAKFPVAGLSFDESGVLFNGVPFSNCSSAERLLVSMHMGIAMNPKLKVLLIRDGSLLDDESLETVFDVAKKANAQVWIERVSKGKECSVIIEDGEVLTR
ncbi:AAA family ATPase [Maridesulfovibrio sp.]|uniref:AAA family ATPase n=1 Tax=Maridesulfovibrio sp. TaxID=2795000 RepID=UPI002AA915A8|nr:AAA family ATPase [Maridesulfovibrio sp.]